MNKYWSKSQKLPWIVCFTAALFFFYEFIQMNMFNAIDIQLIQAFNLRAAQLGMLSATYFYSNICFLFLSGSILDRFSTRKIILISMFICILGTTAFALSSSILIAGICRFLTGIGSAFCFLSCVRLASRWFPPERSAFVIGLIVTMAMTGGIVAQTPLTLLVNAIGWRQALLMDAGLGLLITVLVFILVIDYPKGEAEKYKKELEHLQSIGAWKSWRLAFFKLQNWFAGIYTSMLNLPIAILGGVWGTPYLLHARGFSATQSSYITSMLFLGCIIGSPTMGWLSDYFSRRRLLMIFGAILSLVIILIILLGPSFQLFSMMGLFFILGLMTSTQVISYPTVAESNPTMITATAVSIVSINAIGGYAIFQPLFGWLVDKKWSGSMLDGVPNYVASDFNWAMAIIPIGFAVGLVVSLLLKETYGGRKK